MTLEPSESTELAACEQVIAKGLNHFVQVGNALIRIRDLKLYRATHATFAAYCKERWDMAKSQAYRAIEAAQVVGVLPIKSEEVRMSPIGGQSLPAPASERVVRPLTQLEPAQQPVAYAKAVEAAGGGAPTAKQVQAAVDELKPKRDEFANALGFETTEEATEAVEEADQPKKKSPAYRPSNGMQYARMAITQLEKIDPRDTQRTEAFDHVNAWIQKQN